MDICHYRDQESCQCSFCARFSCAANGRFPELYNRIKATIPNLVICGDYNICHEAIDIHDPIRNKKSLWILPEERAWLDTFRKWFIIDFVF
jgi:exonuclease III